MFDYKGKIGDHLKRISEPHDSGKYSLNSKSKAATKDFFESLKYHSQNVYLEKSHVKGIECFYN